MAFEGPFQLKLFFRTSKSAPKSTIYMKAVPKECNTALGSRDEGGIEKMLSCFGKG